MKRIIAVGLLLTIAFSGQLMAVEKLMFLSSDNEVHSLYYYNPIKGETENVISYPVNDVVGYDVTPDGGLLVFSVINPVENDRLSLRLETSEYPYEDENIIMTYAVNSYETVRGQYKIAVDPKAEYVACVDTLGTMMIDLDQNQKKYIFTHNPNEDTVVCGGFYNWGGEFSPDGSKFCLKSYCIANRQRYDVYDLENRSYFKITDQSNFTGFAWLTDSEGILISSNSCGQTGGLFVSDLTPGNGLINLTECRLSSARCNKYFKDFYSRFYYPQMIDSARLLVFAAGHKIDGTLLQDVIIIDQEEQVITQVFSGEVVEMKMSPSGRYLAAVINPCRLKSEGSLYIYDFRTNHGEYVNQEDMTCSQLNWVDLPY